MEKIKVVIVDDQPIQLIVLSSYFSEETYDVYTYEKPEDAFLHAQKSHREVFIIDYFMPQINGVDLIRQIKEISHEHLCFLYTAEPIKKNSDIDEVIQKPVIKAQLLEMIHQHIKI